MTVRKVVFWSHLVCGVAVGLVVAVMSITGILLAYELQITRLMETRVATETSGAPPLSADEIAILAVEQSGGRATSVTFSSDPAIPVAAGWGRSDTILLDPTTGAALSSDTAGAQAFFGAVMQVHRWLVPVFSREVGGAVTGVSNLVFLFLIASGAYLWLPRVWKWRMFRNNLFFRRDLPTARARDFNWHHVFGVWALIPLLVIVISGTVISYPWASNLIYSAYGEEAPARRGPRDGSGMRGAGGSSGDVDLAPQGVTLQQVVDSAAETDAGWNRITLTLPREGAETVAAMVDTGTGRQPARQTTLVFSRDDGALVETQGIEDRSPASRVRLWMRFVHTGEYYGLLGQTIAAIASVASLVMVYTGLALSYRRLIRPLFRRRASA
ncbi:PepSY-associated TM helix domain-containing protein [Tropicimonas marinistellae]|uniref:PepSY-associated TM helix domain-containing protein n=1 Tax=Tropicimonas marinistellae TaxID=1739787 RepID=UPI000830066E|nr:PepSY-associated TM helix domain-containing protein [Tropicimonas marinistellae]